jgi:DNA-binding LacI/PurR family transcriptional regulator
MWLASEIDPSLTTVNTPRSEMGVTAAKYLLARLSGAQVSFPALHDTDLVVRQSTAPPP